MQRSITSKPSIMWGLNSLGRVWAPFAELSCSCPWDWPPRAASHHWGAKPDTLLMLKGLFCLKATGLELQWSVGYEFPMAHLKILSLILLLQITCCPFAAEKWEGAAVLQVRLGKDREAEVPLRGREMRVFHCPCIFRNAQPLLNQHFLSLSHQ